MVKLLKKRPNSRRAIATTFCPPEDCTEALEDLEFDLPTIQLVDLKLRDGFLNLTSYLRSSEVYFWWPINAHQFARLLSEIGKQCGAKIGSLTMMLSSAHIREQNFGKAEQVIKHYKRKRSGSERTF